MRVQTELGIGCVMMNRRIRYDGGLLELSPADWEAEGIVRARRVEVAPFELDSLEITVNRWKTCVAAGMCRARDNAVEPGRALANLSSEEAERFCGFMGGRLPTSDEWLFASSRGGTRRYAWGQTGLVCRRAAFGLVDGPCASGAAGPELAGARPDGVSPEGAFDLAGNLAEWARQPEGRMVARGGSFRSRAAAELKSWSFERAVAGAPHIGARCAYDVNHRSHTD
jgi:formylglycine-generating enzyme required for sulfatase activity